MDLKVLYHWRHFYPKMPRQIKKTMKLITIILFAGCIQVSARGYSQITLSETNAPLQEVFEKIQQQSGYDFICTYEILKEAGNVTVRVRNASLQQALKECLKGKSLTYVIIGTTVVVQPQQQFYHNTSTVAATIALQPPPVEIHGRVTNPQGEPLQNVSVLISGTQIGTTTDSDGRFSLTAPDNRNVVLEVSSVGFQPKRVNLGQQTQINVILEIDAAGLSDVVVIGYGTQRRSEITGAISTISGEDISSVPSSGIQGALQGRVAGVNITPTSGQPGGALDMNIRGVATFGSGNPLFVIDGIPIMAETSSRNFNPISSINPDDIKSIDILKDASAAAIYGARGANGVVIITTNRGKSGDNKLQFKTSQGVSTVTHLLPMMSTKQWIPYSSEAYANAGRPIPIAFVEPNLSKNLLTNTNWQKEAYTPAFRQNYWLGLSGGTQSSNYSFSGGYLDEDGTLPQSRFRRASLSLNSDFKVHKILKIGETVHLTRSIWNGTFNQASSPMRQLNQQAPTVPVYNPDAVGGFDGPRLIYGPVGRANTIADFTLFENNNTQNRIVGSSYAEIQLLPGLSNRFAVGGEITLGRAFGYIPVYDEGDRVNTLGLLDEKRYDENNFSVENMTTYKRVFNNVHSLTVLVGFTQQESWYRETSVQMRTFPSDDLRTVEAGFEKRNIGGRETGWKLSSQIGRLNYSYKSKYNLMGIVRRDGSSRFGKNNRYGVFPSVSTSWLINKESFMKDIHSISNLTLRASWGQVGSQDISDFAQYATISSGVDYVFGSNQTLSPGFSYLNSGNSDLKWEVTTQTNIGVDIGLLDRKLSLVIDYYIKNTDGILVQLPIPTTSGIRRDNGPFVNAGSLQNKGLEFSATYSNNLGAFNYSVSGNIYTNKNKITSLNSGLPIYGSLRSGKQTATTITQEGGEMGAFYGYVMEGIFKDKTELDKHAIQPGSDEGDVMFKDLNNDGVINALDQTNIGSPNPDFAYGFNTSVSYKNFDLTFFLVGKYGGKLYNLVWSDLNEGEGDNNATTEQLRRWTPDNRITDIPRAITGNPGQNTRPSSRFVEDASYLRMQNIQLGYNIEANSMKRFKMTRFRIYASAENLFTITKYRGYNPEIGKLTEGARSSLTKGIDFAMYPLPRTFEIGIQANF